MESDYDKWLTEPYEDREPSEEDELKNDIYEAIKNGDFVYSEEITDEIDITGWFYDWHKEAILDDYGQFIMVNTKEDLGKMVFDMIKFENRFEIVMIYEDDESNEDFIIIKIY